MRKIIIYTLISFFSFHAVAYIPKTHYILQRTSDLHGSGIYLVDQDLTFQSPNYGTLHLKEQWLIEGGESMRVRIFGKDEQNQDILFTYLYSKNKRFSVDPQGIVRASNVSSEFFEPIFHFRTTDFIKKFLHRLGILPSEGLVESNKYLKTDTLKHDPESFVRLSRNDGTVHYAVGPRPTSEQSFSPAVWIEQDQFHIRKLKPSSDVEIIANKYQRYHNNLWLAQNRDIRWGEHRVLIHVTGVKNYDRNSQIKDRLKAVQFNPQKEPSLRAKPPTNPLIVDFYKRFR